MQVWDARNRIVGIEYPDTIWAMENLAETYHNVGRYTEAEKLVIQVLEVRNRILGDEHPHTIWAMANLAATYQNIGKYIKAEELQIQVLDLRNQMLGVEHPDTILAKANLAETYRHLGKHTEAEKPEIHVVDKVNTNIAQSTEAKNLEIQVPDATSNVSTGEYSEAVGADTNVAGMHDHLPGHLFFTPLANRVSKFKSKLTDLIHNKKGSVKNSF